MDILSVIEEYETLLKTKEDVETYFEEHPEDLKVLFIDKCFIIKGFDYRIFMYKVKHVLTDCGRPKYIQDFEFEHGYKLYDVEHELTEHCSYWEKIIYSINNYRFMKTSNLYDIYKSMEEVSEEKFFEELEKETHIKNIRELPHFNNLTTVFDGNKENDNERWPLS
jgi:hypothetical protein